MELEPREMPKLGGSTAGFITLIVVLCLIILISITAIIFLLQERTDSDDEGLRRKSHRPRTTIYVTPLEDEGSQQGSWLRRTYQRLTFARTASNDRLPRINIGQYSREPSSSSQDGWRSESLDDLYLKTQSRQLNQHFQDENIRNSFSTYQSVRRLSSHGSKSSSGVRFDLTASHIPPTEREHYVPSPASLLPNIHAQLSSPTLSSPLSSPTSPLRRSQVISLDRPISSLSLNAAPRSAQDVTHPDRKSVV